MENDTQPKSSISRSILWLVVLAVIVVGGMWYTQSEKKTDIPTIKIGAALGLTGICAEFGEGERAAVTLAVEEANKAGGINGKLIEVIFEDTLCDNKSTVSAIQKLVNVDRIVALIGPTWGDSFQGGYPLLREKKILAISPSTAIEALELTGQPLDFSFSTWFPARLETDALQKYVVSKGLKQITLVHDQDPFGIMSAKVFKERASGNSIEIIEEHEVAVGTSDFKTIVARIKSKSPQAIFASFVTPEEKAIFIQQARQLGTKVPILSTAEIQNPSLLSSFGKVLEGVIYTYPKGAGGYESFADKYKARFGIAPQGPSASNAYDAVNILVAALRTGVESGEKLEQAILATDSAGATYNKLNFSDKHQIASGAFEIKTIKNGQFVRVEK